MRQKNYATPSTERKAHLSIASFFDCDILQQDAGTDICRDLGLEMIEDGASDPAGREWAQLTL